MFLTGRKGGVSLSLEHLVQLVFLVAVVMLMFFPAFISQVGTDDYRSKLSVANDAQILFELGQSISGNLNFYFNSLNYIVDLKRDGVFVRSQAESSRNPPLQRPFLSNSYIMIGEANDTNPVIVKNNNALNLLKTSSSGAASAASDLCEAYKAKLLSQSLIIGIDAAHGGPDTTTITHNLFNEEKYARQLTTSTKVALELKNINSTASRPLDRPVNKIITGSERLQALSSSTVLFSFHTSHSSISQNQLIITYNEFDDAKNLACVLQSKLISEFSSVQTRPKILSSYHEPMLDAQIPALMLEVGAPANHPQNTDRLANIITKTIQEFYQQ
ncbi:N-acetylmuramoyl-L-alanine amidase [Candidatus Woesearchaeota archaeon]|nr:N-acetylmuramoyl-L-alanine amidase [Candidatus Woesearchaeota archaeon]